MQDMAPISRTEKLIINLCSPAIYCIKLGCSPFVGYAPYREITAWKERDYRRLVKYVDRGEEIPGRVKEEFYGTLCGRLALGSARLRKHLNS